MSNGNVLVGLTLDKSGSMYSMKDATIEGVNAFLAEQRELDGICRMSITLFDTALKVAAVALDVREMADFNAKTYMPGGGTALLDAVGATIEGMDLWLENNPSYDGSKLVVIWTDGEENSSRTYDQAQINSMIEARQEQGWNFQFMGAGDGWRAAEHFKAIPQDNQFFFTNSVAANARSYAALSTSTRGLRSTGNYSGVE